ncbi:MAG: succinyl-diaminopimelate desuccinylase [Magnetococcales bacterium]|nr:succinyl-diaminopimelate desuccinylase [Magnetococcales bacterium]
MTTKRPYGDPLPLLQALIRVPSITPEDHGCQAILIQRLERLGFEVHRLKHGVVENFYARLGSSGRNFCFAGHTDVVPPGKPERWGCDPFEGRIEDGMVIGRGACDMKGGLAAMVAAVERFLERRPLTSDSISFLITGDEEGDAVDGTVKVLDWLQERGEALDLCLVGEPTSSTELGDCIKNGRRGSVNGHITFHGVQGHVAYPHLAKNPIHSAMMRLARVAALHLDEGTPDFDPSSLQFTGIHSGGQATNVIPGDLEARFNIRFNTLHTPETLRQGVERVLMEGMEGEPDYDFSWNVSGLPFRTKPGALLETLRQAIGEVTEIAPELSTSGGTSDARFISQVCPQTCEFGLLNRTMHKADECVPVAHLEMLTQVYFTLLLRLFP